MQPNQIILNNQKFIYILFVLIIDKNDFFFIF